MPDILCMQLEYKMFVNSLNANIYIGYPYLNYLFISYLYLLVTENIFQLVPKLSS